MTSQAKTVADYLAELPEERRVALEIVRKTIKKHLPDGFEEIMQYGMISYVVPLKLYPAGYLNRKNEPLPFVSLGSQKNHMAIYLMNVYGNKEVEKWFVEAYKKSGKKFDMGKSCVRFKRADDLPLEVIGKVIEMTPVEAYIKNYEKARAK